MAGKRKVITSCGSGMTAGMPVFRLMCVFKELIKKMPGAISTGVLWLGLKLANEASRVAIYDEVSVLNYLRITY